MIDSLTNKPIEVIDYGDGEPFVLVQLDQLELVKKLLDEAGIQYSVHEDEYSVNGKPYVAWIDLPHQVDVSSVQRLLDESDAPKRIAAGVRRVAVVDDIEALAARAVSDLDDLHDFGAHLHVMWTRFRLWVQAGNTLQSRNNKTASVVSERDLIKRNARYRTKYVQALSLVQLITVFEAFLFDFLRLLLTNEPRHLAQKKQIDVSLALSAADREALVLLIADRELNDLKYDRPKVWFGYMNKIVMLGCPTEGEIEQFAEMKAARDLLIHNSGIVNKTYVEKAGTKARYSAGEEVVIDRRYFDASWMLAKKLVDEITVSAKLRLSGSAPP